MKRVYFSVAVALALAPAWRAVHAQTAAATKLRVIASAQAAAAKVTVSPASLTLAPGMMQAFTAAVTGTANQNVTWSATGGSISPAGVYTAGTTAGTFTVSATITGGTVSGRALVTTSGLPQIVQYLSDLAWTSMTNGWGPVERDRSNGENGAGDGLPMKIRGTSYAKGLGAHAASDIRFPLSASCSTFAAVVGTDDEVGANGSIVFQVWTDGVQRYNSGVVTGTTPAKALSVDVTGTKELALIITDGGDGNTSDHGDWADARVSCRDTTPPSITTTTPPAGATSVALGTQVTATFSEEIAAATLSTSTFTLTPASNVPVAATVTYDKPTSTVTLVPTSGLLSNTTYTAKIKGGAVKDTSGNALAVDRVWTFTTIQVDTTPPTVTTVSPAAATTQVATATSVIATFSEAMNPSSITSAVLTLVPQGSAAVVAATVAYDQTSRTATLTPAAGLVSGMTYTATVKSGSAGARDLAGNALLQDKVWTFSTAPDWSYLSDRSWKSVSNGWGPVELDRSNGEDQAGDGHPLTLNGVVYSKGLGAHAPSDIRYAIGGACRSFTASVGVDDEVGANGSVVFQVLIDGVKRFDSGVMTGASPTQAVSLDLTGANELALIVSDSGDGPTADHADWANAQVSCRVQPPSTGIAIFPSDDIQAKIAAAAPGSTFTLKAGVHRMQTISPRDGDTITGEPGAVLSGARLLTAFTRAGSYWVAAGQTQHGVQHGECQTAYPRCGYPEQLFIDDQLLVHVASLAEVGPGKWFFDYGAQKIYFADDPTGRRVETSVTTTAIDATGNNVTVSGLTVEKYANLAQFGAITAAGKSGWLVFGNEVRWNHGAGIGIGTAARVLSNSVHHNGQLGIGGVGDDVVVEGNEIAYNNTAHFYHGWEAGGTKFVQTSGLMVRRNFVHHNAGPGLWTDIDNIGTTYEYNTTEDNYAPTPDAAAPGIMHEISWGATIRYNVVRRNGFGFADWLWGAGILVAASPNVEIYGNLLDGNASAIGAVQQNRGSGTYGAHEIANLWVHDNTMNLCDGSTGLVEDVGDASYFTSRNNRFDRNSYQLGSKIRPFMWMDAERTQSEWNAYGEDAGAAGQTTVSH